MNDYLDYFNYDDYFDYFGYFLSDPKTVASEPEDPSIQCVTPTLNPIPYISVSYKIMHH